MDASTLLNIHVQQKRIYSLLNEALDLTRQLADAADRNDQVAIQMLISMREEPVQKLRVARNAILQQRDALPPAESQRLTGLLNRTVPGTEEEAPLVKQIESNDRLLRQVMDLDQAISRKLAREKSFYQS